MRAAEIELLLASDASVGGVDRRALARDAVAGRLIRVGQGAYVAVAEWHALAPPERHVVMMRAVQARSSRALVFSHWSAAVAHGLPVRRGRLKLVHRTTPPGSADNTAGVRVHPFALPDGDLVEVHGLLCTGVARTAVDVAAASTFRDAVMVADAALAAIESSGGSREDLRAAWLRAQPRRAWLKVGAVMDFADARSGSAGESTSRVTMRALRLPAPVLQQVFSDAFGFVARVDFWWPHLGLVGEMDGRVKYSDPAITGGDPARVLYEEKRREDRLRFLVNRVVRWNWHEAETPALLGPKLAAVGLTPLLPARSSV